MASTLESLNLLGKTVHGRPVAHAELFEENGFWRWRIVDARGIEYVDGGNFHTREAAAESLNQAFDPSRND